MLYIAALVAALWQFFGKGKVIYRLTSAITVLLEMVLCLYNTVMPALSRYIENVFGGEYMDYELKYVLEQ